MTHVRHVVVIGLALCVVACSRQRLTVTPTMLHSYVPQFRAAGRAEVPLDPYGTATLALDRVLSVEIDGEVKQLSIAALIANCPDARPFASDQVTRRKYAA
jgi:hypothetical protein